MSELFDDEDDKELIAEDVFVKAEEVIIDCKQPTTSDARRRLENLLDEKRLRDELEDFMDF